MRSQPEGNTPLHSAGRSTAVLMRQSGLYDWRAEVSLEDLASEFFDLFAEQHVDQDQH